MAFTSPELIAAKVDDPQPNDNKNQAIPALEITHLSAGYGQRRAIEDVSVSITAGKRVGLIGPNGAGKSTLFRAIVGLLTPMGGQVCINGSTDRQSRQQAAYVPQFEDVDWNFPVAVIDVVIMGLSRQVGWLRLPGKLHREIAQQALGRVGMADYAKRQIGELSGGQKRRVFIARALAQGATILLLDEPFSGVDAMAQHTLFDILDQLRGDGVTVLLATHDLNLAASHFDELFILNQHLIAYGTPQQVFKPEILAQAFGGQLAIWQDGEQVVMFTDQHC
ncbi:MAG: metal ABC transporter ATP-binding protein [Chloroflexota bacterium]